MNHFQEFWSKNKAWLRLPLIFVILVAVYFIGPLRLCYVPSGSMEPNIPTWSICFVNVWTPYEKIETGDVVVYTRKSDGLRIIHRVIQITDEGMVTKGDANSVDDGLSVTEDNLFGKYLFHIPKVGRLINRIKSPLGIAIIAVLAVILLITSAADENRRKKAEPDEKSDGEAQKKEEKED